MDIIRWRLACLSVADEFDLRAHEGLGLTWKDVATAAAAGIPQGLTVSLFSLYLNRDESEAAYRNFVEGFVPPTAGPVRPEVQRAIAVSAYSARFNLRRWPTRALNSEMPTTTPVS